MAAPPDQDETMANPKREALWLALILVLAALLRVWYLAEVVKAPDFRALRQDMEVQDYQARAMLSGDWTPPPGRNDPEIDRNPLLSSPRIPYYLAVVYRLTGAAILPRGCSRQPWVWPASRSCFCWHGACSGAPRAC